MKWVYFKPKIRWARRATCPHSKHIRTRIYMVLIKQNLWWAEYIKTHFINAQTKSRQDLNLGLPQESHAP
jgi:hypothetical protein